MAHEQYNFDELIERRGTGCVKWDEAAAADIIPLWVADMDFRVAPPIQEALQRRLDHGVFGYTHVGDEYYDAVCSWFARRHQWTTIDRRHILYTTGVVPAISCVLKALTMPGENVVLMTPVYNCFFSSVRNSGCLVLENRLLAPQPGGDGRYHIDWDDLEQKLSEAKSTVLLLCNPHNPVGRLWTRQELQRVGDLCQQYGVTLVSDEIHCELTMPGQVFVPMATVHAEAVVLNSPSKAFNTAGLQAANIICSNPTLRRRIDRAININEVCDLNPFGPVALVAAYNHSEAWLDALREYLWQNFLCLRQFLAKYLPALTVTPLEATYLAWVCIRPLGLDADTLCQRLLDHAHVQVSSGTIYGDADYIRINLACPRQRLLEGLRRMADELSK